ncbi:helix-turn-helix domain-containing protein [Ligilactobacillus salivarius]|uniref:helix-turn-helix domain-containing protein n=1 Tax=Ligilactobacillus salivarius TaxID=1624 RepID=UPI00298C0148|nr:helix-turn-helix transcriptional regulator [Ligilactobacillus salivarius]
MLTDLKKIRLEKGLTQQEVADKTNISISMLAMMENGYRRGSDETKIKLANFYKESVESLFFANNYHFKCENNDKTSQNDSNSDKGRTEHNERT